MGQIAASAAEQATGLHEVNTAVNQMDQVTQQNAAMVEQTTAATHALKGQSDELGRLIGAFTVTRRLSPRASSAPTAASRPGTAVRPTPRRVANSGPAAPAAEGWQEF